MDSNFILVLTLVIKERRDCVRFKYNNATQ
jgi:hypothetical protein